MVRRKVGIEIWSAFWTWQEIDLFNPCAMTAEITCLDVISVKYHIHCNARNNARKQDVMKYGHQMKVTHLYIFEQLWCWFYIIYEYDFRFSVDVAPHVSLSILSNQRAFPRIFCRTIMSIEDKHNDSTSNFPSGLWNDKQMYVVYSPMGNVPLHDWQIYRITATRLIGFKTHIGWEP